MLLTVDVTTDENPDSTVIWLHGLGADGHDFEPIVPQLRLSGVTRTRFVFPHAPSRPVTLNAGLTMPAWYDLFSLDRPDLEDEGGIRQSARAVEQLMRRETERGTPTDRIILAGFSQGGAIALHTGVRYAHPLGGIMALSTYVPLPDKFATERNPANANTPVFAAHGITDPTIAYRYGTQSRDELIRYGYPVEWHAYPMGHGVCPEEVRDIRDWLIARLG